MNPLSSFILPVKGLKDGIHNYQFNLDDAFFKAVNPENETKATLQVVLEFDKRPTMYILHMTISGHCQNPCDRCLEQISIPVEGEHELFIKKGDGEDEADIVYLPVFEDQLNIAQYLYEYAIVSFPLMNVIECEEMNNPPCNMDMLNKWDEANDSSEVETKTSIWDELNNLNLE